MSLHIAVMGLLCRVLLATAYHPQLGAHLEDSSIDESFECYVRFVRTSFKGGVLVLHNHYADVARYVAAIRVPHAIFDAGLRYNVSQLEQLVQQSYGLAMMLVAKRSDLYAYAQFQQLMQFVLQRARYLWVVLARNIIKELTGHLNVVARLNVTVLTWNDTRVYTSFPPGDGTCSEACRMRELGHCQRLTFEQLFSDGLPEWFAECPVLFHLMNPPPAILHFRSDSEQPLVPGYELALINIICRRSNLTKDPWNLFLNLQTCESGSINYMDTVSLYVPTAGPRAQWQNVVRVFQVPLWLAILAFFLLNALAWWLVGAGATSYAECVLGSLLVLLNGAGPLVVSWTVCALVLVAAYQSQVLSTLLTPVADEQPFSDQQQLLASDVPTEYGVIPFDAWTLSGMFEIMTHNKLMSRSSKPPAQLLFGLTAKYLAREPGKRTLVTFEEPNRYNINTMFRVL